LKNPDTLSLTLKGTQKTGRRAKGTPNKVTADLRMWINEILDKNRKQIAKDIKRLEPQQRVAIFERKEYFELSDLEHLTVSLYKDLTDEELNDRIKDLSGKLGIEPLTIEVIDRREQVIMDHRQNPVFKSNLIVFIISVQRAKRRGAPEPL
jgi:hypothetical protein